MAHTRILGFLAPASSSSLHPRSSEASSADARSTICQRSQACTSTSRSHQSQRGLVCLPRHLVGSQGATLASAHRQLLSTCSAFTQTPALVPVREVSNRQELKPLPRDVENIADDPALHNPLARQNRLSPGWMGVSAYSPILPRSPS